MTADENELLQTANDIAEVIGRRDVDRLAPLLAPGFVCRSDAGRTSSDAETFLQSIRNIPGEILFVRLDRVVVDVAGDAAMLTGVQQAQVRIDGTVIDDRRGFADFFVRVDGAWKLRAAADFSLPA